MSVIRLRHHDCCFSIYSIISLIIDRKQTSQEIKVLIQQNVHFQLILDKY